MTKLLALAAALAVTAGAASAQNTFELDRARSDASSITLTNVQADEAGTLEVYSFNEDGDLGSFLGATTITAGGTADVQVELNQPADGRVRVVMMNSNRNVASLNVQAPLTN